MKRILQVQVNIWVWRVGIAVLVLIGFFVLVGINGYVTFSHLAESLLPQAWLQFGISTFTALMFVAVGILVWLYGRERRIAQTLFGFCLMMVLVFGTETGALGNQKFLDFLSTWGSIIAIPLLSMLLLHFPHDYFSLAQERSESRTSPKAAVLVRVMQVVAPIYLLTLSVCGICLLVGSVMFAISVTTPANWFWAVSYLYEFMGIGGTITTVSLSYYLAASHREKQQIRLFVLGVIFAVAPFFLLTLFPHAFGSGSRYIVDSQLSTLTFILFPLALGYSILRYQLLIYDVYIRRAVAWIIGSVGLLLLVYAVVIITESFAVALPSFVAMLIVGVTALVAPLIWWFARMLTERLFYKETLYYHRLIEKPASLLDTVLDLDEVVRLLVTSAMHIFETANVCLFVLDENDGYYHVLPGVQQGEGEETRLPMLDELMHIFHPQDAHKEGYWLHEQLSLVMQLDQVTRPVFLSELHAPSTMARFGLMFYEEMHVEGEEEKVLVTPIRVQGKMVGMLFLGERGDHQRYAGPDFDAIMLLLGRFSPLLETARLAQKARQHATLLNNLYSVSMLPQDAFATVKELASAYASVAAHALPVVAKIWLCEQNTQRVRCAAVSGEGTQLFVHEQLLLKRQEDWQAIFYEGASSPHWQENTQYLPSCLCAVPHVPFAWLPLKLGSKNVGILTVVYQRPHLFTKEEVRVLEMFTSQCAVALENTRITLALREAYERQKELDTLKDQFIMTTSHELRTPLTAVLGYVELLEQYGNELSEEARMSFIRKAHRGCDELALMMENIMDASRVHIDAEKVHVQEVVLNESVAHVVEILGALISAEKRAVKVNIPAGMVVLADNLRLRQVILNIFNNALKYSPAGASIEVSAQEQGALVVVAIRDYGSGVPKEAQAHLFERFVRLERDMNSPVRGAGLGLYICKRLVEAMGGKIWVESAGNAGEGSSFLFELPLAAQVSLPSQHHDSSHAVSRS